MDYVRRTSGTLSLSLSTRKMMTAKITAAATARSDRRASQNPPPTLQRSPRLSQNQPPTDKGLDVAVPEGGDSSKKRKRSTQNDGDGKQKESSAFKQQQVERQRLLREENRRIKERRGFDFGDIPPIGPIVGRLYEACWAETSFYPAPKVLDSEFLATTSSDGSGRIWKADDGVLVTSLTRNFV
ncbi:hypothetical protein RHMOL_Rhmol06G0265000 [Rhododendron molle]|uniref:Uncharacterized protein n=1 Tax=Rhododendron molle TaxID=49168 RepID=A0ACC0NIU8_RHOML|nr:hypothetical protein RHMOL_Rhmol06G0265000 [Rhododendron molle]